MNDKGELNQFKKIDKGTEACHDGDSEALGLGSAAQASEAT